MIDIHCHMLPGIDDGAPSLEVALDMARIAVKDGITELACTPHIYPGMYDNDAKSISQATENLRCALAEAGIPLKLTYAADTHVMPDLVEKLQQGTVPTFNGGRYFLLEPPHHVAPPNFEDFVFRLMVAGYIPIVTHPERLSWIEQDYAVFGRLAKHGAWMQLTAGSLTGRFGSDARYWGERMLDDGLVHVIATDAHGTQRRAPLLAEGAAAAGKWVGADEAARMVLERPAAALSNTEPALVTPIKSLIAGNPKSSSSFFGTIKSWVGLSH